MSVQCHYNEKLAAKIISCKGNTLCADWKDARESVEKTGKIKTPVEKYLPEKVLEGFFNNDHHNVHNVLEIFKGLEQAFLSLHIYAANICGNTVNIVDYSLLKTYTGYYAVNVASCISNHADILKEMGYLPNEYNDEFKIGGINKDIDKIAYDLFMNHLYCKRMKKIMQRVMRIMDDIKVAKYIYQYSGKEDFKDEEIAHYCKQFVLTPPKDCSQKKTGNISTEDRGCVSDAEASVGRKQIESKLESKTVDKNQSNSVNAKEDEILDQDMYEDGPTDGTGPTQSTKNLEKDHAAVHGTTSTGESRSDARILITRRPSDGISHQSYQKNFDQNNQAQGSYNNLVNQAVCLPPSYLQHPYYKQYPGIYSAEDQQQQQHQHILSTRTNLPVSSSDMFYNQPTNLDHNQLPYPQNTHPNIMPSPYNTHVFQHNFQDTNPEHSQRADQHVNACSNPESSRTQIEPPHNVQFHGNRYNPEHSQRADQHINAYSNPESSRTQIEPPHNVQFQGNRYNPEHSQRTDQHIEVYSNPGSSETQIEPPQNVQFEENGPTNPGYTTQ